MPLWLTVRRNALQLVGCCVFVSKELRPSEKMKLRLTAPAVESDLRFRVNSGFIGLTDGSAHRILGEPIASPPA